MTEIKRCSLSAKKTPTALVTDLSLGLKCGV